MNPDSNPLVSIICLCYNQERFVTQALQSVMNQTYLNIQLIVVNDASTDNTAQVITHFLFHYPSAIFLNLSENLGMTRAFNKGLELAQGQYIIDLAGDDVLHPERIEKQVQAFQQLDASYGIVFSDAWLINEESQKKGTFYKRNADGTLSENVPSGDIYKELLHRYCVCAPTMMSRIEVYQELNGYDESLAYEDFDFFIRSSRTYKYKYLNEVLTEYRQSAQSDSQKWYRKKYNPHLASTLRVCQKAYQLNRTQEEQTALSHRVRYHLRQSFFTENFDLVKEYAALLQKMQQMDRLSAGIVLLSKLHIRSGFLFNWYRRVRR